MEKIKEEMRLLLASTRRRQFWGRWANALVLVFPLFVGGYLLWFVGDRIYLEIFPPPPPSPVPYRGDPVDFLFRAIGEGVRRGAASVVNDLILTFAYPLFFVAPFLLTLPLTIPQVLRWKKPGRILLLRPFDRSGGSGLLKRILRKEVAGLGHIYTLADSAIKVPWYVRIPFLIGQLGLFCFRMRPIRDTIGIERLARMMKKTRLRNLNWFNSRSKLFPLRCTGQCWQACVKFLVLKVDVILVDISDFSENITWELELCKNLGVDHRVLFLTEKDFALTAKEYHKPNSIDGKKDFPVFTYDHRGIKDLKVFRFHMAKWIVINRESTTRPRLKRNERKDCGTITPSYSEKLAFRERLQEAGYWVGICTTFLLAYGPIFWIVLASSGVPVRENDLGVFFYLLMPGTLMSCFFEELSSFCLPNIPPPPAEVEVF